MQVQQAVAAINASPLLAAAGQEPLPLPTPAALDLQAAIVGSRLRLEAAQKHVGAVDAQLQLQSQREELQAAVAQLAQAVAGARAPFEWADGPLVQVRCRCFLVRL